MKYYSETLKEFFDTEEALNQAEQNKELEAAKVEAEAPKPLTKKQLATKVEEADAKLKDAYADYEVAKKQVEELSKVYLESVEKILKPAKDAVTEAERLRYDAICAFNRNYGAYQVTLTGDQAAKEMLRAIRDINELQRKMFSNAFWF